jgi:hypothetical protein
MKRTAGRYFILLLLTAAAAACESPVSTTPPAAESNSTTSTTPAVAAPTLGESESLGPDCEGENYYCANMAAENPGLHEICSVAAIDGQPVPQSASYPVQVVDPQTGKQCYCHCGAVTGL